MKKLYRRLTSSLFLTVIVSLLEISLIIIFLLFLRFLGEALIDFYAIQINEALAYFISRAVFIMVEVIFFLVVVDKNENPEYKIPWITLILLLPYLAFVIYLFFANHGLGRVEKFVVKRNKEIKKDEFVLNKEERLAFQENIPITYRGVFKYLRRTTGMQCTRNNRVTYFKNGEAFFPDLVHSLKLAKEYIFIEFFIIGEGKWWSEIEKVLLEKVKEGVEVRILYDALGSLAILPNNYARKMRKKGLKIYKFHPFKPMLSGTYNNRDHRKIVVVDHQLAYTGGMNLADEYANSIERFGYWKDTMVKIEGPGIGNLITIFLENFDLSCGRISDYHKYLAKPYCHYEDEGFIYAFGDGPGSYGNNEPIGEENYIQIINGALKTLWISTPYLIPTYRLLEALKTAAKRGVDVKLFIPGIPDKRIVYWLAKTEFKQLLDSGVKVYIYKPGFNHEKQIVADNILAFCGTINFDFRSLTHHFECGVTMYDVPCIKDMVKDFEEMESLSIEAQAGKKLNFIQKTIVAVIKIFRTML